MFRSFIDTLYAVEKVSEFRFLANFAVRWYRLFAKNEKRQKCCKYDTYSIFKTPPSTLRVVTSLFKKMGGIILLIIFWRVSGALSTD